MAGLAIETTVSPYGDENVYGIPIKRYDVDGVPGLGLLEAVSFAVLRQSHAIEAVTSAMTEMVKLHQQKVEDLGEVMATLSEALASMDPEDSDVEKRSAVSAAKIARANELLAKYGIEKMSVDGDGQVTFESTYYKQTDIQLALDTANNDLQQVMAGLQGLVNKRDNAFVAANKVVAKLNSTSLAAIRAFGD